jgi:hypothetical protein
VYEQNRERMKQMTGFTLESGGVGNVEISRDAHGIANISKITMELPGTENQLSGADLF